jgi:hypothetical protein
MRTRIITVGVYFANAVMAAINWSVFYDNPSGHHLGFAIFSTLTVYFMGISMRFFMPD